MKITYDPQADAAYIYLTTESKVARTQPITDDVIVDLNADGQVIGIELLSLRRSGFDPDVQVVYPARMTLEEMIHRVEAAAHPIQHDSPPTDPHQQQP